MPALDDGRRGRRPLGRVSRPSVIARSWGVPALLATIVLVGGTVASAQERGSVHARPLPFSDDPYPPPPLATPLDRHLRADLLAFDGDRVHLRWDWSDPEQLADFDRFVPVRKTLDGAFDWVDGALAARGTAGLRLRLGMLSDLRVKVRMELADPHDLGVVLAKPGTSDESVLCLLQDRLFTAFDKAAGNTNMINKLGGIPASVPGHVEFRYVDRKKPPRLAAGDAVSLDVVRKGSRTTFTIDPSGGKAVVLSGEDTDTAMTHFNPGLYTSGGAARIGMLEIEGRIDPAWCAANGVLPQLADDLLSKGNRLSKVERKAAERIVKFEQQPPLEDLAADDPARKKWVTPDQLVALLADTNLPLVIRIRAAEALTAGAFDGGPAADRVSELLDSPDQSARVLAWQVLRPLLPWHFRYEPDGEAKARREAALLVASYFTERDDAQVEGKVFVDGYWYTPSRADSVRGEWESAWDLRTPRVRLKTNLTGEWAVWYLGAMEAAYARMVELVGREPPPDMLPLTVMLFRTKEDYAGFCEELGYSSRSEWGRFVDGDEHLGCITFVRKQAPQWALNAVAKLFLRSASGKVWPTWFDEGRASWFGSGDYMTARWDGTTLRTGMRAEGNAARRLRAEVANGRAWSIDQVLANDPRLLEGRQRMMWYVSAWALHHWLVAEAPDEVRERFARWQSVMENLETSPTDVDEVGRKQFHAAFDGRLEPLESQFRAWLEKF